MANLRITKEEKIGGDKHPLIKYTFEKRKPNGERETQERQVFRHGNAVTALLYNPEGRTVILVRQFRIASYVNGNPEGTLLETSAGLLEEGEAPEAAVLREIKEETGYAVPAVQKVYEAYSSAGVFDEMIYYYVAPYAPEQKVAKGGGLEEEGEDVKVIEMPFDEAMRRVRSGELKDAKTILLLLHAQVAGLV